MAHRNGMVADFVWSLCGLTIFAVIMYHLHIVNVEKDFLFATVGNEYLKYMNKSLSLYWQKKLDYGLLVLFV